MSSSHHLSSILFISLLLFLQSLLQIPIFTEAACPAAYPEICWDQLSLPAPTDPDATTQPAAAIPRLVRHAMVYIGSQSAFYIYGGMNPTDNKVKNEMWRIQAVPPVPPTTYTWTVSGVHLVQQTPPSELKPRMDHAMVEYSRGDGTYSLYIYAGLGDVRLKDLWRFDISSLTWTQVTAPPGNGVGYRFGHSMVVMTDLTQGGMDTASTSLWVYGGSDQVNLIRDELNIYTPTSDTWTLDASVTRPSPSVNHCAAQIHDFCMYIYGGITSYAPQTVSAQVWEYCAGNPSNGSWVNPRPLGWTDYTPVIESVTSPVKPIGRLNRYSHACSRADDRLLVFGGRPDSGNPNYANDLIDFDPTLNTWGNVVQNTMFNNSAGTAPGIREEMAVASFNYNGDAYMVIHGGRAPSSNYDDMWSINYRRPRCPDGYYSPQGTVDCYACPAGSYSLEGSYQCTNCTAGEYTNGQADNQCRKCPVGTYTLTGPVGSVGECIPCPLGTYSNDTGRDTMCDNCPAGTYSTNTVGQFECQPCPAGTENPNTGRILISACTNCGAGYYSIEGTDSCPQCPAGTYSPSPGQPNNCTICPAGTWSSVQATGCTDCAAGTSNETPGSTSAASCYDCPAGTYAPAPGTPYCIDCPAGTFSTAVGAQSIATCQNCELGKYNPTPGANSSDACVGCPPGTYQNGAGADACLLCPKGTWNDEIGAVGVGDCKDCPAGTYAPVEGTPSVDLCVDCEPGRYQPVPGQDFCRLCPNGTYTSGTRGDSVDSCINCPPDTYSWEGQSTCTACGISNSGGANLTSSDGTRLHYAMSGWENCLLCDGSENTGYGWVKNGHFDHNPWHGFWKEDPSASSTGCTYDMSSGYLSMTSSSTTTTCAYQQTLKLSTESTFPFFMSASAWNSALTRGSSDAFQAEFHITLVNGTEQRFYLDFADSPTSTWKTESASHRPDQINDKYYLENLYQISTVVITLRLQNIQGTARWDEIMFSPFSVNMCNCTKINRESQYFTIDLFERDSCEHCTIGKFCNGAGQFQCPDNTYSFGGYVQCLTCSKGLACKDGIATTCDTTQFKNETSNQCETCPLDSSCRNTDRHICSPGTYGQGLRHCLPCVPGSYCDRDGCTSCETCPPGTTSNFLRTSCYDCPVGHYSPDGSACITCPSGTYANSTGSPSCTACPSGTNTGCVGSSDIFFCKTV